MKILIIDNYDSFTYNLVHLVKSIGPEVDVFRNDRFSLDAVENYDKILLSPGPGIPSEAGQLLEVIRRYASHKSMLGVCLGHQAIGEAFGAGLENIPEVFHGVQSRIDITQKDSLFNGIGDSTLAGRYHSWIVSDKNLPSCLEVTARSQEGYIMALRHRQYDVKGIQFHPESILTPLGKKMIENWLGNTKTATDNLCKLIKNVGE